jgi:hypothetical protein
LAGGVTCAAALKSWPSVNSKSNSGCSPLAGTVIAESFDPAWA